MTGARPRRTADQHPTPAGGADLAAPRRPAPRTVLLTAVLAGGVVGLGLSAAHPEWFDTSTATAGIPTFNLRTEPAPLPSPGGGVSPLVLPPSQLPVLPQPTLPGPDAVDLGGPVDQSVLIDEITPADEVVVESGGGGGAAGGE